MSVELRVHARPSAILRNTWSLCLRVCDPWQNVSSLWDGRQECQELSLRTVISEWGWKEELGKDPQISCWRDKSRTRHRNGNWERGRGDDYHDWELNWHRAKEWGKSLGRIWWQKPGPWWETEQAAASAVSQGRGGDKEIWPQLLINLYWLIYVFPHSRKNLRKFKRIYIYFRET